MFLSYSAFMIKSSFTQLVRITQFLFLANICFYVPQMLGDSFVDTGEVSLKVYITFKLRSFFLHLLSVYLYFEFFWLLSILEYHEAFVYYLLWELPATCSIYQNERVCAQVWLCCCLKRYHSFTAINLYHCWVVLTCQPLLVVDAHVKCALCLNTRSSCWSKLQTLP